MAKQIFNLKNIIKYANCEISKRQLMASYGARNGYQIMNDQIEIEKAEKVRNMIYERKKGMEVIYITGGAGSGKSTLAEYMAEAQGYDFKLAASGEHMFDGYDKEPCLILDDFRASDMRFGEFLKLLDPFHESDAAARYHNRNMSNLKLLAITNTQAPNTIYKFFQDTNASEPINQFYRRLSYTYYEIVIVDKLHPYSNTIYEYRIDDETGDIIEKYNLGTMEKVFKFYNITEEDILNNKKGHKCIDALFDKTQLDMTTIDDLKEEVKDTRQDKPIRIPYFNI